MVGRGAILRRLLALVPNERAAGAGPDRSEGRGPEVALIGGEAGIGKSRMVAELRAALPPETSVLIGRAGTGAPGRPYSVLLDALEPVVADWTSIPSALSAREDSIRLLLHPIAPAVDDCVEREYGPEEAMRGAVDLVRFAAPPPAVLIFEDLHGADPESISLFGRLAVTPDLGALLIGTYRPEDLGRGHPLAVLVADLERRRSVAHFSLSRLSRSSVGEFVSAIYDKPVSWHVADAVHRRTGGNPFFVEELLLATREHDPEQLDTIPLPWNLTEVVLRHLDGLSEEERRVIDAAAVLGSRFPFDVLAAVVAINEDDLIRVLRRLVEVGLLFEDEPDVFSFRHALTQEAIAGQLLGRERRRLHERALTVMCEQSSDDYTALAYHAEGAGRYEQVVDFARRGSTQYLRLGLTHQAIRLAEQGLAEDGNDLELREVASRAAWLVGLYDLARRHALEWRRLAALSGDRASEGAALRHLARVEWESGSSEGQRAYTEQALALAEQAGPSEDLAMAMTLMAEVHMLAIDRISGHDPKEAISWADKALALADQLDLPRVRPRALVNKGSAMVDNNGTVQAGMVVLAQARQHADAVGDAWNGERAINNQLHWGMRLWPIERLQTAVNDLRNAASQSGREGYVTSTWANWAGVLDIVRGHMDSAREHVALARTANAEGKEQWWSLAQEIELDLEAERPDEAASRLALVPPTGPDTPVHWEEVKSFETAAAELCALRGKTDEAVQRLLTTAGPGRGRTDMVRGPVLAAGITLLRRGAGPEAVRKVLDRLNDTWPAWPEEPPALLQHLEATILEAEGRTEDALAQYEEALADRYGYRPVKMVADAEQGVARCLLAAGKTDDALIHAERAVVLLERWPGWRAADAAALVRRVRPSHATGDGALTAREREVAALIAEGMTNGQIARRLYISTKTASVHVSNILAKLGMGSRSEVAAWAARGGLEEISA
jgi:DNA-binding CsgD family transcriptional regulator